MADEYWDTPEAKQFLEEVMTHVVPLMAEIKKKRKRGQMVFGAVECPKCHGQLDYSVSNYNGHTSGKCRTVGCLQWVE